MENIKDMNLVGSAYRNADTLDFKITKITVVEFIQVPTDNMKGTKVQTLGARAVAGAWCMTGCLGHNYYYGHGCNY